MSLYEAVDVWKRISEAELIRYRCFRDLSTNKYSVQSADFYHTPLDSKQISEMERQYLELLAEQDPNKRSANSFNSLEEAIKAHEEEFDS